MQGQTEEILADELLERIHETDLTIDDLLAVMTYSLHENTTLLTQAREEGANIGDIGVRASDLKCRAEGALR